MGIVIDENLDFNTTAKVLANSAGRALGGIISKYKKLRGLGFNTYTTLYEAGVTPILDYCSGVWGSQKFGQIDAIQNRAIRFYLGIHRFAPNLAINGDVGWISSQVRRKVNMLRLWNRMMKLDSERLTKKVFMWDWNRRKSVGNWSSDVYNIFQDLGMLNVYRDLSTINIATAKIKLHESCRQNWKVEILNVPKLRTYCIFKSTFETEPFVYRIHDRRKRSLLSQFRCGILPLKVETGRYLQIPPEDRICEFCDGNCIEDEMHLFFDCDFYSDLRFEFLENVFVKYPNFF